MRPRPQLYTKPLGLALLLATALGCEPTTILVSEQAQLTFEPEDITAGGTVALRGVDHVIDGTELCGPLDLYPADDDDDSDAVAACFTQAVAGPATLDDDCLVPTGAGAVSWTFEARRCDALPDPVDDTFELTVVDPADAAPRVEFPYRQAAQDPDFRLYLPGRTDSIPGPELPDGFWPAEGEPIRWLEGGQGDLFVGFFTEADAHRLLWARSDVAVSLEADDGEAPDLGGVPNHVQVRPAAAGSGTIQVTRGEDTWTIGTWATAAPEEIASLDLLVVAAVDPEGVEFPLAVRAVVRDDDGQPVFGAPVTWGIAGKGPAGLQLLEPDGDASYALLTPDCLPNPLQARTYTQRVQARVGDLVAQAPITWTLAAADPDNPREGAIPPRLADGHAHWLAASNDRFPDRG